MEEPRISSLIARHEGWVKTLSPQEAYSFRVRLAMGLFLRGVTASQTVNGWWIHFHQQGWGVEVPTRDLLLAELVAWELILT